MDDSSPYIPFSQRNGISLVPQQLQLGQVSEEFRRLIIYALQQEVHRSSLQRYLDRFFKPDGVRIASDLQVKLLKTDPDEVELDPEGFYQGMKKLLSDQEHGFLFDVVEFFHRHPNCSADFKSDLVSAFKDSYLAYRLMPDGTVIVIGNDAQADAFLSSLHLAEKHAANGARQHLIKAGSLLRTGDWTGSVRESIHSVEAVAKMFAPSSKTLGEALNVLERENDLHGALKKAFSQLYGYTNDEEGLRHAQVFKDHPNVGEAEALFMLGACASFVSYLLTKMSDQA